MADIRIIHVYDTVAIAKNWHFFVEGVEKVLHYSLDDMTLDDVYNGLMSGKNGMFTVFNDNQYIGFFIIGVEPHMETKDLILMQGYLKSGSPKEASDACYEKAYEVARATGCRRIKTYSTRPGMDRYYEKRGWKKGYTEYMKDMEEAHG